MTDQRPDIAEIRRQYQVADDTMIDYRPRAFGAVDVPFTNSVKMTRTEGEMLDQLTLRKGISGLLDFRDQAKQAFAEADRRYPDQPLPAGMSEREGRSWQGNDGHRDAFRHAYWSAGMASAQGADWAKAFTTAHEGLPGNYANREAMDLYNNSVGIRIAQENPGATRAQLADLVGAAVQRGEMLVIDASGNLQWSDQVQIGKHGLSSNEVIGPQLETPKVPAGDGLSQRAAVETAPGAATQADLALQQMRQDPIYGQLLQAMQSHGMDKDPQLAANLYAGCKQQGFEQVSHIVLGKPITDANGRPDRNFFVFDGSRNPIGANYAAVSEGQSQRVSEQDAAALAMTAAQSREHEQASLRNEQQNIAALRV